MNNSLQSYLSVSVGIFMKYERYMMCYWKGEEGRTFSVFRSIENTISRHYFVGVNSFVLEISFFFRSLWIFLVNFSVGGDDEGHIVCLCFELSSTAAEGCLYNRFYVQNKLKSSDASHSHKVVDTNRMLRSFCCPQFNGKCET